jgi:thiaminase
VLLPGPFVRTKNTHGTGCSLSSALAALRPQRDSWAQAAADAKVWLTGALAGSDLLRVGSGAGPVHHFHELWPAPRFSAEMWERISPIREAITTMPFIQALSDGSLPWPNFSFYLTQDALYLREYARSLARVAALAPDQDAQVFFAQASAGALEAELSLHRSLLADDRSSAPAPAVPPTRPCAATALASPVTAGYTDHLNRACAGGDYPEAVAAVLPCFWLYQHIGELLAGRAAQWGGTGAHPYAAWIDTYGDPAFAELTEQAIALTDRAAATASVLQRTAMAAAFERSSQYEWMFFAQGTDLPDWPV